MKALKAMAIAAGLIAFLGCEDGTVIPNPDLEPPYGGYIYYVRSGNSDICKIDPTTGEGVGWGVPGTPFTRGYNFDAATGDGRVWVGGALYDEYDGTYDYSIWEVGTSWDDRIRHVVAYGLTYDGEYLWAPKYHYPEDYYEILRINPDTQESELAFNFYDDVGFKGFAWDGDYLWALVVLRYDYEIWKLDPEDGTKLHSIKAPTDAARGLTWDGEALWVNDTKTSRLYRVNPKDGSVFGYVQVDPPGRLPPPAPYGLAFEFPSE